MALFELFSKREADDTGLPDQASDSELLAWGLDLRALPEADDDGDIVIDLRPKHAAPRPLVAAPRRTRPLRADQAR